MSPDNNGRRVAIIRGLRTPFARSGTLFDGLSSLDLGKITAVELINRTEISPREINKVFIGNVIPSVRTPNIAREIALGSGVPASVPAFTVTSACASSCHAFTSAIDSILSGDSDVVVAGGVDSSHGSPYFSGKGTVSKHYGSSKGINLLDRAMPIFRMGAGEDALSFPLLPERSSGHSLGEAAEKLARKYHITREDQDSFASRSHTLASRAQSEGIFEDEIIHTFVPPDFTDIVSADNCVRYDISPEALAALPPIFDSEFGTVTEGNSAPLADGASLILLMSEEKARALGYKPIAFVKSYAYSSVDTTDELLMAPAYSATAALDRAGIGLGDVDLMEVHEAFSSQVIAYVRALDSKGFAREKLGRSQPLGEVDMERLNVSGGSLAIGHALGATGARIITTLAYRMSKRKGNFGLVSLASAGGLGVSVVLEKE